MKLVGDLKEKVEKAKTTEKAKEIIEEAGMELTDEELNQVAGGAANPFEEAPSEAFSLFDAE